jgi:hypothetical protein
LSAAAIMLLRLAFLEGGGGRTRKAALRRYVLDEHPPARVHIFRLRLPMMHRAQWEGEKSNSGMAFAWFLWQRGHVGPTAVDRISWESAPASGAINGSGDGLSRRNQSAVKANGSRSQLPLALVAPRVADPRGDWPDIPDFLLRRAP